VISSQEKMKIMTFGNFSHNSPNETLDIEKLA